jgi:hypothetical protein
MDSDQAQAAADRLAAKLNELDLDDDERAVLEVVLTVGADSVEPVGDEVEGFAFDAFMGLGGGTLGPGLVPAESVSLSFGHIQLTYAKQMPDGSALGKQK